MLGSLHIRTLFSKVDVSLFEAKESEASDFKNHPVLVTMDSPYGILALYLTPEEANDLAVKLNGILQELDRKRIEGML